MHVPHPQPHKFAPVRRESHLVASIIHEIHAPSTTCKLDWVCHCTGREIWGWLRWSYGRIKKIKQTGGLKDCQAIFERNLNRVNLSQKNAISCFIAGLKHELNMVVNLTNHFTLSQVYMTTRMQVFHISAIRQTSVTTSQQVPSKRYMEQRWWQTSSTNSQLWKLCSS